MPNSGDFSTEYRRLRYTQSDDFKQTRWYDESLLTDAITGLKFPRSEMVRVNGRWLHRDNVDEEEFERRGRR